MIRRATDAVMAIIPPVLVWSYWAYLRGILWGSVMWFVFFSSGWWLSHIWHRKEWPR